LLGYGVNAEQHTIMESALVSRETSRRIEQVKNLVGFTISCTVSLKHIQNRKLM